MTLVTPADRCGLLIACTLMVLAGCGTPDDKHPAEGKPGPAIEAAEVAGANAAEAAFDYATAAGSWAGIYRHHPDDETAALHLARNLRYSGQVQPAIDVASNFIGRHPASATLVAELGRDYLAADRLELAARTLHKATEMSPAEWQVQSALGVALDYQGKYAEAEAAYAQALALSPDNPIVLNNLGLSQAEAGQLLEARETLQKAADQPTATAQVRQNLALIKALTGDVAGAERLSRQDLPPDMVRANGVYYRALAGAARPTP
jgi:Flp pilus assembly protein TadD